MELVAWSAKWSVGNDKLDQQHKSIIDIINKLIRSYNKEINQEIIFSLLNDFQISANGHLHYEEYLLKKHDYFDLDNHYKIHRNYLDTFYTQLFKTRNDCSPDNLYKLITDIKNWWSTHICIEDMKYRSLFQADNF